MNQTESPRYPAWSEVARRVVIFVGDYLDFNGQYWIGGRQRYVRDLALLIRAWGRDVVVVQKARVGFERMCPAGVPVIGLPARLTLKGDLLFWRKAARVARAGDVFLYASGDDAWPFIRPGAKAVQHGVWWDGEQEGWFRLLQNIRAKGMAKSVRSVLCVDTNFINWLRCQGNAGYRLADRCVYIPNYADLEKTPISERSDADRLAIISARRNEPIRGLDLLVDALGILCASGIDFEAHISTNQGHELLIQRARALGCAERLSVSSDSMDEVLARYRGFHVAVVPTRWSEGTSLACVEALAAGLAVVCTPVGGLANLVVPGFNGYVVAPTAECIAGALKQLSDRGTLAQMRSNALAMRPALGMSHWRKSVGAWLAA